jgi:hypothetical protein
VAVKSVRAGPIPAEADGKKYGGKTLNTLNTSTPKFFGIVKSTRLERGYFFIESYYSGEATDIFSHVSQILPGNNLPKRFDRVMFHIAVDVKSGRKMAVEVEVYPVIPPQTAKAGG